MRVPEALGYSILLSLRSHLHLLMVGEGPKWLLDPLVFAAHWRAHRQTGSSSRQMRLVSCHRSQFPSWQQLSVAWRPSHRALLKAARSPVAISLRLRKPAVCRFLIRPMAAIIGILFRPLVSIRSRSCTSFWVAIGVDSCYIPDVC